MAGHFGSKPKPPPPPPPPPPAGLTTPAGVILPVGWNLLRTDTFGTAGSVANYDQLHALYNEGQYYNSDTNGLIVNNPINAQQQTYQHFEKSIAFSTDHLSIQGRGQPNGTIQSAQMCSRWSDRSFVYEARFKIPAVLGTWLEFWAYAVIAGDRSELDVEIVESIAGAEDIHQCFFANGGDTQTATVSGGDSHFSATATGYAGFANRYQNAAYDPSTAPHYYTIYYDDTGPGTIKRYLDGVLMYSATWKWNKSLGGTGFGPDAAAIIDLAIGGGWPGNVTSPSTWSGDLDIYSISFYTQRAIPTGEAWNQGHKSGNAKLSADSLTATLAAGDATDNAVYATTNVSSGKFYWEVVPTGDTTHCGVGIGTILSSVTLGRYLGLDPNTLGWFGAGGVYSWNTGVASWGSFTSGARLCFALDLTNFKLWGRVGTTGNWCGDVIGNQNPATNTGGYALPVALQSNICPAGNLHSTTTANSILGAFASGSWVGTPPAGFGAL